MWVVTVFRVDGQLFALLPVRPYFAALPFVDINFSTKDDSKYASES